MLTLSTTAFVQKSNRTIVNMTDNKNHITEKSGYHDSLESSPHRRGSILAPDESGAVHGESFVTGNTLYAKLQRAAGKLKLEQRGIERVPEDERTDKHVYKVGTMWVSEVHMQDTRIADPVMLQLLTSYSAQPIWSFHHSQLVC